MIYMNNVMAQTKSGELLSREQIDNKYKWNLTDIYKTEDLWEQDYKWVDENINSYKNFEGKLGSSAQSLLEAIKFDDEISIKMERLGLYAMLARDLDLGNSEGQARADRVSVLGTKAAAASSYLRPEILVIGEEKINSLMEQSKDLKLYKQVFHNLFRRKEHTLPKEQEEILAQASQVMGLPGTAFSVFTNADLQFPTVKDPDGNDIKISHARYGASLYSTDRSYRERVYKNYYKTYMDYKNTLAALFNGEMKTHIFNIKTRKYNTSREAALDANNIPISVYDNLIKTVNENLAPLHRWAKMRKKILGYSELHPYDAYVTLFPGVKKEYEYDKGVDIVRESLKPLGTDYLASLEKAFNNSWIDVYETKGKRSGAYSSGTTFGVHPYVLLNWTSQLNDVFTLTHEMGHNMHSYYTGLNQPYPYANYSIFVAEVASTANEALLQDYLIEQAQTKEEKLALIEKYINQIVQTFYRQTAFAEFEQKVHEKVERDEPLTPETLTPLYREITTKYWGPDMIIDEEEAYTWARIPHFYYNFYVFQYATGLAASQALVANIKKEGKPAIDKYLSFLKSGSSDYPINILKTAGVDMTSPDPVLKTTQKLNELLDQMEKLLNEK